MKSCTRISISRRTRAHTRDSCFCATGVPSCTAAGLRLGRGEPPLRSDRVGPDGTFHNLVEAPQQHFALRVRSRLIDARLDACLRSLRDPPVLAVRPVPELDRIVRPKIRLRHLVRMEVPL